MAFTHLGGVQVITDEPAESPLSKVQAKTVYYKRIRKLTLATGAVWYCDDLYQGSDPKCGVIRGYVAKRDGNPVGRPAARSAGGAPVAKLLRVIEENKSLRKKLSEMRRQRDTWKKRAIEAERSLSTINQAISQY